MSSAFPRTCVTPQGFRFAIHKPSYTVANLRQRDFVQPLGELRGEVVDNSRNFPAGEVVVEQADWIYEIPNPLPFRGATYITKSWGDAAAENPAAITLPAPPLASMSVYLKQWGREADFRKNPAAPFKHLPLPVLLALAANSTDSLDLTILAKLCCEFTFDRDGRPTGLCYLEDGGGRRRANILLPALFEILVNNEHLPDSYKEVMVLRPGAQGDSEIVGDKNGDTHVFEYLRRNSYIAGGHYAANMANDAIRYHIRDLRQADMDGLRHIYYQRTYVQLAASLGLRLPPNRHSLSTKALEQLRGNIVAKLAQNDPVGCDAATLWGWNYGYGCAADNYRLHASHQMIHNQFAMLPGELETVGGPPIQAYGCGDLISDFMSQYRAATGTCFFDDYYWAIKHNKRLDGREDLASSLIVHADERVILFVPKAQTSQWELQLMPVQRVGNIIEADTKTRESIDRAILTAMRLLTGLGAKMITVIEYSKRLHGAAPGQRLLYSFLPKLPDSPGAFSEAQLRWISGHYPEDFARALRCQGTVSAP